MSVDTGALINLAITAINASLPFIRGKAPAVASAIDAVTAAAPVVAEVYTDLKPIVARTIASLKADPTTAPAQLAELEEAEKILDANFDDALAKAIAEDEADGG